MGRLRITAIVPTWNEEGLIVETLSSLRAARVDELLVVDGGSTDSTVGRATGLADRVVQAAGGVFGQLNHAAREASGDVLLFHYADVSFPQDGGAALSRAVDSGAVGGAFSLEFASARRRYRVVAGGANFRNRLGLGPFGDQSIFVKKEVFERLGGFSRNVFLEDLHLVRRLKREGRFVILEERVLASVRRWEVDGFLPTLYQHWKWTLVYLLSAGKAGGSSKGATAVDLLRTRR